MRLAFGGAVQLVSSRVVLSTSIQSLGDLAEADGVDDAKSPLCFYIRPYHFTLAKAIISTNFCREHPVYSMLRKLFFTNHVVMTG